LGIVGQFYLHGFSDSISYIQEVYSRSNVINYAVTLVTLSPAIGAYYWREKRRSMRPSAVGERGDIVAHGAAGTRGPAACSAPS
jgi:hypothetical protein